MKLGDKKKRLTMGIIGGGLVAAYIVLLVTDNISDGWTLLFLIILAFVPDAVEFFQKRVDPEAYEAELKKKEIENKAAEEISHVKLSRTWGGTVCEFITAILLIVSWILILRNTSTVYDCPLLEIAGLGTAGAIWFHVSAYFHMTLGIKPQNLKQLKLCIYRKRVLGLICAIFLLCIVLNPNISFNTWFFIAMMMLMIGFPSKYFFLGVK